MIARNRHFGTSQNDAKSQNTHIPYEFWWFLGFVTKLSWRILIIIDFHLFYVYYWTSAYKVDKGCDFGTFIFDVKHCAILTILHLWSSKKTEVIFSRLLFCCLARARSIKNKSVLFRPVRYQRCSEPPPTSKSPGRI